MRNVKAELTYNEVWGRVKSVMSCKVDKQKGKGLSTNDYTTEDKEKLDNITTIQIEEIDRLFDKKGDKLL